MCYWVLISTKWKDKTWVQTSKIWKVVNVTYSIHQVYRLSYSSKWRCCFWVYIFHKPNREIVEFLSGFLTFQRNITIRLHDKDSISTKCIWFSNSWFLVIVCLPVWEYTFHFLWGCGCAGAPGWTQTKIQISRRANSQASIQTFEKCSLL